MRSGGNKGFTLRQLPKEYPMTKQQQKLRDALEFCGIKKGISKMELMEKMKNCLPEYFRRGDDQDLHS